MKGPSLLFEKYNFLGSPPLVRGVPPLAFCLRPSSHQENLNSSGNNAFGVVSSEIFLQFQVVVPFQKLILDSEKDSGTYDSREKSLEHTV